MKMDVQVKTSTVGPLIKGQPGMGSVAIWVRGAPVAKKKHCMVCCQLDDGIIRRAQVSSEDDYIHLFFYDDLTNGVHTYRCGYFHGYGNERIKWSLLNKYQFTIAHPSDPIDFIFGSCRRYIEGPVNFGTHEGDVIFRSIMNQRPQFMLSIGDKIYFDPLGSITARENLRDMRSLYRKIYNMPHQKKLYQETIGYDICDDHDFQCNDAGQRTRLHNRKSSACGLAAYREYQHYLGPMAGAGTPLWYTFNRGNSHFFVFDVRSERAELETNPTLISDDQLEAFKHWIGDPEKSGQYKFVVSSSPMISQIEADSWSGFPRQQRAVIEAILGTDANGRDIDKVVLLVGDAHCARVGIYDVCDSFGVNKGRVIEVLSSGLVATGHDQGKPFNKLVDIIDYNRNNNFPHTIDNSTKGGLKFVTQLASMCYPNPAAPKNLIDRLRSPFKRVVDNVFVRICEGSAGLIVAIFNQDGKELHQMSLPI